MKKILFIIILFASFSRFYRLPDWMPFISDQGVFYLSARDALLSEKFPLQSITASVVWLHQGPLFTYLLIPGLLFSGFHPLSGAVLTGFLSILTIILIYFLGRIWLSKKVGLLSAGIFAFSPLAVSDSRFAYHTSVIPFFLAVCLLLLYRRKYLLAGLFLGFLFQLQLATYLFWPVFVYELVRQKYHFRFRDLAAFLLGILPILISGPVSTLGPFVWSVYHVINHSVSSQINISGYINLLNNFIFPAFPQISLAIFILSCVFAASSRRRVFLWFFIPLMGILFNSIVSGGYFSLLYLPLSVLLGYFLSRLPRLIVSLILLVYIVSGSAYLAGNHYLTGLIRLEPGLSSKINVSRSILSESVTIHPQIILTGHDNEYESPAAAYSYLVWWQSRSYPPAGQYSRFYLDESSLTIRMVQ
jgi:4-amino-4-deoxy-L-arabinose transferase-like glycosyltransferase